MGCGASSQKAEPPIPAPDPTGIVNVKSFSDEEGKAFEKKEDPTESSTALTNREIQDEGERNTSTPPKKLPESIGGGSQGVQPLRRAWSEDIPVSGPDGPAEEKTVEEKDSDLDGYEPTWDDPSKPRKATVIGRPFTVSQDGTVMAPSMDSSKGKLPAASTSNALPKLEPVNSSSKVASFLKPPDEFDENEDDVLSLGEPIAKPTAERLDLEDTSMTKLYRPGQKKGEGGRPSVDDQEFQNDPGSWREPRQTSSTSQAQPQPQPDWLVGEECVEGFHGSPNSQTYGVRFDRSSDLQGVDESEIGDVMGEEFAERPFEASNLQEDPSFPIKPLETVDWNTNTGDYSPGTSQYVDGISEAEGHGSYRMEAEEEEPVVKKDDPWANIQSQYQIQDADSRAPSALGPRGGSREPRRPHTAVLGEEGDEEHYYEDDEMNEADGVVLWDGVQPISNVAPEDWQPVEDVDDSEILYDDAALPQPIVVHVTEDGVYASLPPPQHLVGMEEDVALQYSEEELYGSRENTEHSHSHPQKNYDMGFGDDRDIDFPSAPSTPGAPAEPIEVLDFNDFSDDFGTEPIRL